MTLSWYVGLLHHMHPKKFPKRPELLWDRDADAQSIEVMMAIAKAMAATVEPD